MRNILLAAVMLGVSFLAYRACTGQAVERKAAPRAGGVVRDVVRSGRQVGQSTGEALRSVDFGGR